MWLPTRSGWGVGWYAAARTDDLADVDEYLAKAVPSGSVPDVSFIGRFQPANDRPGG
ncbi:hypothetical protein [Streptomyces sp. NPDC059894]|uniref:hypothetical protein n=1 Tax=unclassified Streptomyces TaxID=2593676 RepID=UPI003647CE02